MNEEIIRCPYCGEMPTLFRAYGRTGKIFDGFFYACHNFECPKRPKSDYCETAEEAAEAWNRRAND